MLVVLYLWLNSSDVSQAACCFITLFALVPGISPAVGFCGDELKRRRQLALVSSLTAL